MSARVLMYTTAVCPYCIRAKQLLKAALETESPGIFIYRADAQAAYDKLNKP